MSNRDNILLSYFFYHLLAYFNSNVVLFEIYEKDKSAFSNFLPLQLHLFSTEQDFCYPIYIFFNSFILGVASWSNCWKSSFFWGSIPCLSQWHRFCFLVVPVVSKALQSLQKILLISVWHTFGQTLKKRVFLGVGVLRMINYLVILLCLPQNYLIVSKLNFMLVFLLVLIISSLYGVLRWFWLLSLVLSYLH